MQKTINTFLKSRTGQYAIRFIQICLGLLFIYASLDKIWNPGLFAKAISNYRIIPLGLLHISAIVLPWLEMMCGLALVFNQYQRGANAIIIILLGVFILAIVSAMSRGLDFNCGCFSVNSEESNVGVLKIFQNLGLLFSAAALEYRTRLFAQKPG